jgi:hypothetical protein
MDNNANFKLSFGGVEEAVNQFKERMEPGIHDCIVLGVSLGELENEKKSKYIGIKVINHEKTREHEERMFIGETALPYTLSRIKHLVKAMYDEITSAKDYTISELDKLLAGKEVRIKFVGEEYEYTNKDGDTVLAVRPSFAFRGFAENIDVPPYATGLKYNPNSNWDFKKLQKEVDDTPKELKVNNDMQF